MNFSKKYHRLKRILNNPNITGKKEMHTHLAMSILLEETKDEKAFTKYAKRLFNTSFKIILTSPILNEYALRFTSLSNEEKQDFGQRFFNILTSSHKLTSVHFELRDTLDNSNIDEAGYSSSLKLIAVLKDSYVLSDMNFFMCALLHEFTHHVYLHNPEFAPIPTSQIKAIIEYGCLGFTDRRREPMEAPAYFVEEYLKKHNFTLSLISKIKQKRQTPDAEKHR